MAGEANLRAAVKRALSPYGVVKRVENAADVGTPDVAYCLKGRAGWLELKHLPAWPVRPATPVRIAHLRPEQVLWLEAWCAAGGAAFLLLQVATTYLLLTAGAARRLYRRELTATELRAAALVGGERVFPTEEILRCLISHP